MVIDSLAWFIAKRYLFSKKSHSIINIISIVSVVAISIPVAAMIILLSVSNGFSDFVVNLNSTFDPEVKIHQEGGKYFESDKELIVQLEKLEGVVCASQYIEGNVVVVANGLNKVITLRGIDEDYTDVFPIVDNIAYGTFNKYNMLMGSGIAYEIDYILGVSGEVTIYSPVAKVERVFGISKYFNSEQISVSGIYELDVYTDSKYSLAPIGFAQRVLSQENKLSAIGLKLDSYSKVDRVIGEIKKLDKINDGGYLIENQLEQQKLYYTIVKQEKAAIYMMLFFVLLIASMTLIGSVLMLIIEKRKQVEVLKNIGANNTLVGKIFFYQTMMLTMIGGVVGVVIGVVVTLTQYYFGFISISSSSSLIGDYPVLLQFSDVIVTLVAIVIIGLITSFITKKQSIK